jgi:Flp pilus assembly CpaE family ATPase
MLGVARVLTVANDFQAVHLSASKGRPLRQVSARSPILRDLDALINDLMGVHTPHSKLNGRGLFGRVLHAFSH